MELHNRSIGPITRSDCFLTGAKISALGVDEQRVNVIIDIASPHEDWSALGDGFRVDVRIETQALERATVMPVSALFRRDDGWSTFVAENGVVHEREVELVLRSGRFAAARSGVRAGESVVIFPPSSLNFHLCRTISH
jgi:HlyD family secretion protein